MSVLPRSRSRAREGLANCCGRSSQTATALTCFDRPTRPSGNKKNGTPPSDPRQGTLAFRRSYRRPPSSLTSASISRSRTIVKNPDPSRTGEEEWTVPFCFCWVNRNLPSTMEQTVKRAFVNRSVVTLDVKGGPSSKSHTEYE